MFEHDTKESRENQVVIMDFDLKTMRELLRYIYCGKVIGLKSSALELLPAADYVSYFVQIIKSFNYFCLLVQFGGAHRQLREKFDDQLGI